MVGRMVGNYRVVRKLGAGGTGVVYAAEHPEIGRKVALKILQADVAEDGSAISRFRNEARVVNEIRHPNIVDVFDFGRAETGEHYFTMELLEGESLAQRLTRGPLPILQAIRIAGRVADSLSSAHACHVLHRDLKPDNIFLARQGPSTEIVKVLDFGLAKLLENREAASFVTRTGAVMGTPYYMSPEQCRDSGDVDVRSDVYSLGIVLYQMLTGKLPFAGNTITKVLLQHISDPPAAPRTLRADIPDEVEALVLRALAKKPADRFQTMDEFCRALGGEVTPRVTTPMPVDAPPVASTHPSPAEMVTTLGSSTGSIAGSTARLQRRLMGRGARPWLWLGGAVTVAAAVVLLATTRRSETAPPVIAPPGPTPPAVIAPPPAPVPAPEPVVAAPVPATMPAPKTKERRPRRSHAADSPAEPAAPAPQPPVAIPAPPASASPGPKSVDPPDTIDVRLEVRGGTGSLIPHVRCTAIDRAPMAGCTVTVPRGGRVRVHVEADGRDPQTVTVTESDAPKREVVLRPSVL